MHRYYGWKPDHPDQRDHRFCARPSLVAALGSLIDLRPKCPPVQNQTQLGACTAHGIAGAIMFDQIAQGMPLVPPSRLFVYYNERAREGTIASDAGAAIRDGIKSLNTLGFCPETDWPYDISQFAIKPPAQAYADASHELVTQYERVDNTQADQLKAALSLGRPVIFGCTVYSSFESPSVAGSGDVPMPGLFDRAVGGHCMLLVGYDDERQTWIVRNSWGPDWGQGGYCGMPYPYLTNPDLTSDCWVIRQVPASQPAPGPNPAPQTLRLVDWLPLMQQSFQDARSNFGPLGRGHLAHVEARVIAAAQKRYG